jgi:hypothetical protein
MYYFCTFFDHRYLDRGLALYHSLQQHCLSFQLWILCMDTVSYHTLLQLQLPDVQLITLEDFERGDTELLQSKQDRTLAEYYFTCTPSWPLFILTHFPEIDLITYLDADLFFFADPMPIYEEIDDHSIAIIGHRFSTHLRYLETRGLYNVGWLSFKRDEYALTCLRWWRERCLEWCYDRPEAGRFADQKYLDDWPIRFKNVIVLRHKGANLAPWNLINYNIQLKDGSQIWVDEHPLIFFHFHGLKRIRHWLYNPNLASYKAYPTRLVRHNIYAPYISTLLEMTPAGSSLLPGTIRETGSLWFQALKRLRRLPQNFIEILSGKYIFVIKGQVI